ncbi:MAG: undecaprenyl-diphosphate phosphatase [Cyanobacteria bacterium P01_C01_bin.89]
MNQYGGGVGRWVLWVLVGLGFGLLGHHDGAFAASASDGGALSQVGYIEGIVLGLTQGLTEFLPISSTAHLKVVPVALGMGDPGVALTAVLQLGSVAAVLSYFREDLLNLMKGTKTAITEGNFQNRDFRITLGILLGTIPIVIVGLCIKFFVTDFDNSPLRSITSIAIASIVMAVLLALAEQIGSRERGYGQLNLRDGILIGIAQALAVFPGVSRSGSTLTAGLFLGIERASAARFSFLLGIPAITLAGVIEFPTLLEGSYGPREFGVLAVALLASVVSSYGAIAFLLKFLKTQSTWVFVAYRLIFGVGLLAALNFGWLTEGVG